MGSTESLNYLLLNLV